MNDETPQSEEAASSPPGEAPAEAPASPRPPFVRQVSNRVFPSGRRHDVAGAAAVGEPSPTCPACGQAQRPPARSSARFVSAVRQACVNADCGRELHLQGDRWTLADG